MPNCKAKDDQPSQQHYLPWPVHSLMLLDRFFFVFESVNYVWVTGARGVGRYFIQSRVLSRKFCSAENFGPGPIFQEKSFWVEQFFLKKMDQS